MASEPIDLGNCIHRLIIQQGSLSWTALREIIDEEDVGDEELMETVGELLELDMIRWKDGDTLTDQELPDWAL